jgi:hypothetical protein
MNYATWNLNFDNPDYGIGPEEFIGEIGIHAEGAWVLEEGESNTKILGYVSERIDEEEFANWNVLNITEEEAMELCVSINPEAYLLPDGRISAPARIPSI